MTESPHTSIIAQDLCIEYRQTSRILKKTQLYFSGNGAYTKHTKNPDITFATQFSMPRINALKKIVMNWPGPISAAVYGNHSDALMLLQYIEDHSDLMKRDNLAFHFVYKYGVSFQ